MKPFADFLRGKLLDHRPRMTMGDQDVIDAPEEEHVVEVMVPLYQMGTLDVSKNTRELFRRGRHMPVPHPSSRNPTQAR